MKLANLTKRTDDEVAAAHGEAAAHSSLAAAIAWLGRRYPDAPKGSLVPDVVQLDEYTHDVVFALPGGEHLVYGVT